MAVLLGLVSGTGAFAQAEAPGAHRIASGSDGVGTVSESGVHAVAISDAIGVVDAAEVTFSLDLEPCRVVASASVGRGEAGHLPAGRSGGEVRAARCGIRDVYRL